MWNCDFLLLLTWTSCWITSPNAGLMSRHCNADIEVLVQDCSISVANALEILHSCTKPSICVPPFSFYVMLTGSSSVYIDAFLTGEMDAVSSLADGKDTTQSEDRPPEEKRSSISENKPKRLDRSQFGNFIFQFGKKKRVLENSPLENFIW